MPFLGFSVNDSRVLWLLVVLPVIWWVGRRSIASTGRLRHGVMSGLRMVLVALLVLALAGVQAERKHEAVCVIYLLDQSQSIPAEQREAMFQYVSSEVKTHRQAARRDRAGVIIFGREAAVEVAPTDGDLSWLTHSETTVPRLPEATNLAAGMQLALAVFPPDCVRRLVVVTDGNETAGKSEPIAAVYAEQGIGIDVVPVQLPAIVDIAVERLIIPETPQRGETVEAKIVLNNIMPVVPQEVSASVTGKLRITRTAGARAQVLDEQPVELAPGKNVLRFVHSVDIPEGFYTYDAQFIADGTRAERTLANNRATGFMNLGGRGRVLFLDNPDAAEDFDYLVGRLQSLDIDVERRTSLAAFTSLADLQAYDCIVLANVPRISADAATELNARQVDTLVRNLEMGCGLVMLGGPQSFGAGGWSNTALEEASPVNFSIKNAKIMPVGALLLVIDKSGSMEGEKISISSQAAMEAVRVLGTKDFVGVVAFDSQSQWIIPVQPVGEDRQALTRRIRQIGAGGGTDMYPAMQQGFAALQRVEAAVKHMIIITDGQSQPGDFLRLVRAMRKANVTVSTAAIGLDADLQLLSNIALQGSGKFYAVDSLNAIPRIFIKEAMRVTRPLVYERNQGFTPQQSFPHEILKGVEGSLPPITGFVLTEKKENPLIEIGLRSPHPSDDNLSTLLASWNYGLGKFVVWTTDAGHRWAADWTDWPGYDKLFSQLIRWSMRPRGEEQGILVETEVVDDKLCAIVTTLDEHDQFINFLRISGRVTTPELETASMEFAQTGPGRYEGEITIDAPGNYFLTVAPGSPGTGHGTIRTAISVPFAREFRDTNTNLSLLQSFASQVPVGGTKGEVIESDVLARTPAKSAPVDTFRATLAPAIHVQDAWPLMLLLVATTLFFDILTRRVHLDVTSWIHRAIAAAVPNVAIRRLGTSDMHAPHGSTELATNIDASDGPASSPPSTRTQPSSSTTSGTATQLPTTEPESYTSRLLDAKRRAHRPYESTHEELMKRPDDLDSSDSE